MTQEILFAPYFNLWVLAGFATVVVVFLAYSVWQGLSGWWLRASSALVLLLALANPSLQRENRTALSDIVLLVVDESASQRISDRPEQTTQAIARVEAEVAKLANTELRIVSLSDGEGNAGSLVMSALSEALADEPRNRVAGVLLLTDGQLHDLEHTPDVPAPLHVLLSGRSSDWDRRLIVTNAPAFAILGEPVTLTLRLQDDGAVPAEIGETAQLELSVDGGPPQVVRVPVGKDLQLPVDLPHGGMNVIRFTAPAAAGELTDRNNSAVVRINGVRDRLRVLLVSGEPHAGERTWRNLLKSDSSVDLVHFTILRPPEKQDGVPVSELSLIAFPTRELFLEKIDEFDLIIFDRYKRRGILPGIYLDNIANYVEGGGAVLVAAGPDFASAASIYRTPLGRILPAEPTARVLEQGFTPAITELGERHPVTEGMEQDAARGVAADAPPWGRWFRLIDVEPKSGTAVMSGPDDRPLLVLDRVGSGRVALLASDQAWLWSRGYEGGGPQLELLRRLAHWMMKEPELEEEALWVESDGQSMTIIRRTLEPEVVDFTITLPDGTVQTVSPEQVSPGRFEVTMEGEEIGIYRITEGELSAVAALGPSAPREFERTIADGSALEPAVDSTRGGIRRIEDGTPDLRAVSPGRPAAGRGWLGIMPRGAYQTADVTIRPLLPAWLMLLLVGALSVGAWMWEGRRRGAHYASQT